VDCDAGVVFQTCTLAVRTGSSLLQNNLFLEASDGNLFLESRTSGDIPHALQANNYFRVQNSSFSAETPAIYSTHTGASDKSLLLTWHERLGHRHMRDVAHLLGISMPTKLPICKVCLMGKATRHHFRRSNRDTRTLREAPRPAYLFHSDTIGPLRVTTKGGARYVLIFVCDYSRRIFVYFLKSLSEWLPVFKMFVARMEGYCPSPFGQPLYVHFVCHCGLLPVKGDLPHLLPSANSIARRRV
jgi:hypothetical protein